MPTFNPIEPQERIEILDALRGFALIGIIFHNMLFFSGYAFIPFGDLEQFSSFHLNEKIYDVAIFLIDAKFYMLFSILFATGFYMQFSKHTKDPTAFLKTYRRRIFFLAIIGLIHSLIWFGDILFTFSVIAFILILFRNIKTKNLLRWSLFFMVLPFLIDLALLPFLQAQNIVSHENISSFAHVIYPDMAPKDVINTFQNGTLSELFFLNIHNIMWKYLGYIPSGAFCKILGVFLLGYYLASIQYFTTTVKSNSLLISSFAIGLLATISANLLGGNPYQFPSTLTNIVYKFLGVTGHVFMCIFYITSIFKIVRTSTGKRVFKYLIPVGKMTLTNYLSQTLIMITIFYNFGFNLIGRTNLIPVILIAIIILLLQIIMSNIWLNHFRFGPLEWIWRCLTYKRMLKMR